MANSLTSTVTAPIGPGFTATAVSIVGCRNINFDNRLGTVAVTDNVGRVITFDCNATTTITATATAGVWTFVISQ